MLEDQKLVRLVSANQQAIATMTHNQERRVIGHDRVTVDNHQGRVSFLRAGSILWNPRAELIGILMTDIDRWRWWWVLPGGEVGSTAFRLNAAFAVGQREGVDTLTSRNPNVARAKDAVVLAQLCAVLAGAQGVHAERGIDRVTYYALFDAVMGAGDRAASSAQQYSTMLPPAPPAPRELAPQTAPAGIGTEAPIGQPSSRAPLRSVFPGAPTSAAAEAMIARPSPSPQAKAPVGAPDRTLVRALAHCALQLMRNELPGGFRQAVITVYVEVRAGKLRFSSQLVASDPNADLVVLDPSPQMMRAVEQLVTEDVQLGNGRWTRLTVRLLATENGASLDVQVKG